MTLRKLRRIGSACVALLTLAVSGACGVQRDAPPVVFDVPAREDAHPWVAASGANVAVVWGASADGRTDVFLATSRDGGDTFGRPVQVTAGAGDARLGGEFPPRVALITRADASVPEIVVLWTARGQTTDIRAARSKDGGETFEAPVTLQSSTAVGDRGWPAVAMDADARVHAVWLDHRGLAVDKAAGTGHRSHSSGAEHDGVAMAQKSSLYYASMNASLTEERAVANGVCYCCKTALAAGADGSLYAAWRHVYSGNLRDMALSVSRDGGNSFSSPVRVAEDGWSINGCPDDGPAIAVDEGNTAHLVWPTVITGANPQGAIFYASTRDARTFSPRVRIPTLGALKPTHPQMVVGPSGRIFVAWEESVDGERIAAMREVKPQAGDVPSFGDTVMLSPGEPATYPVLAATDTRLLAVWVTGGDESRVKVRVIPIP